MPFKSKAQQRFMFAAEERGDLPKGTAKRWADETKSIKKLPEKVKKKKRIKKASMSLEVATNALQGLLKSGNALDPFVSSDRVIRLVPSISPEMAAQSTFYRNLIQAYYAPGVSPVDRRKIIGQLMDRATYGPHNNPYIGIPSNSILQRLYRMLLGGMRIPQELRGERKE